MPAELHVELHITTTEHCIMRDLTAAVLPGSIGSSCAHDRNFRLCSAYWEQEC